MVILGFPCNQYGNQEPGDAKDISEGCLLNYGVSFQMMEKIEVNGGSTHPIFQYLKQEMPSFFGRPIKWNFTKFLIDTQGKPAKRFAPVTKAHKLKKHIGTLLISQV